MSESEIHLIQLRLIAQGEMLKIVTHEDVQATQLVVLAQIQRYQVLCSINMQLLQERIGREIQLLVSYLVEVDELQQRILAHVEFLLAIPRIAQDTQVRTFRENHIKGFHLEHATSIKSDNGIFLFRTDGNGVVHALLRIGMTSLNPSQLLGSRFLFTCHDLYLSIAPSDTCLAVFLQHQVQAYGFPHCPVQRLDIDCNLCHNSLFYVYSSKITG